ncbi:MAG: extracellular solute-binding protein [Chloroflexota bacterium]
MLVFSACTPDSNLPSPGTEDNDFNGTIITFATLKDDRAYYEPLMAAFNAENPDVQVQLVELDPSQTMAEIVRLADTAAVSFMSEEDRASQLTRDLTPFMAADPDFDQQDFFPVAFSATDNELMVLPRTIALPLSSYNQDLWLQHHTQPPNPAITWPDLLAALEPIVATDTENIGFLDWNGGADVVRNELATAGITSGATQLDSATAEAILTRIVDLNDTRTVAIPLGSAEQPVTTADIHPRILDEQIMVWPTWMLLLNANDPQPAFTVGHLLTPNTSPVVNSGYIMSSGSQAPDEAWRWLAFLSRQAPPSIAPGDVSTIPARQSLAASGDYWSQLDPSLAEAVRSQLEQPFATTLPDSASVATLNQALVSVLQDGQSIDEATQNLPAIEAPAPSDATDAESTPIAIATPIPTTTADTITIEFIDLYANHTELERLAEQFQREHPNIEVSVARELSGSIMWLPTLSEEFDCFGWVGLGVRKPEEVLDLQPYIDADATFPRDDYPIAVWEPFQIDGGTYALPRELSLPMLAYDQATFATNGLTPPTDDWTFNDLLATAEIIVQKPDITQEGFVSASAGDVDIVLTMFDVSPTRIIDGQLQPNYTHPDLVEALRSYVDLLQRTSLDQRLYGYGPEATTPTDYDKQFIQREVALWLNREFPANERGQYIDGIAVAPPPRQTPELVPSDVGGLGLYISAQTAHPEACWEWITFLQDHTLSGMDGFPARMSLAESEAFAAMAPPGADDVYAAYRDLLQRPPASYYFIDDEDFINDFWFYQAIDQALQGEDIAQTLANAQRLTEAHLACVRGGEDRTACALEVDPEYAGWQQSIEDIAADEEDEEE